MTEHEERRAAFIEALRELTAFLETHPNVDAPQYTTISAFVATKDDIVRNARAASWEKIYNGPYFWLRRTFGNRTAEICYDVAGDRSTVCTRVVTGKTVVPAQPEREVENVEWVCDEPSLLAEKEIV